jgi:hypothetical protein
MNLYEGLRQEAISRMKTLMEFGLSPKVLGQFEAGEVPCLLPEGTVPLSEQKSYYYTVHAFSDAYARDEGKEPLIYMVIPSNVMIHTPSGEEEVEWLYVLLVMPTFLLDTDEPITIQSDGRLEISGFVIQTLFKPDEEDSEAYPMYYEEDSKIGFRMNDQGVLYRDS